MGAARRPPADARRRPQARPRPRRRPVRAPLRLPPWPASGAAAVWITISIRETASARFDGGGRRRRDVRGAVAGGQLELAAVCELGPDRPSITCVNCSLAAGCSPASARAARTAPAAPASCAARPARAPRRRSPPRRAQQLPSSARTTIASGWRGSGTSSPGGARTAREPRQPADRDVAAARLDQREQRAGDPGRRRDLSEREPRAVRIARSVVPSDPRTWRMPRSASAAAPVRSGHDSPIRSPEATGIVQDAGGSSKLQRSKVTGFRTQEGS